MASDVIEIHEMVEVIIKAYFDEKQKFVVTPIKIKWRGRVHDITKLGYYHRYKQGTEMYHIYECTNKTTWFRLKNSSITRVWELEAVSYDQ